MDPIAPEGCQTAARGWRGTPIDTARLRLRALTPNDAEAVTRLLDDWDVSRNTSNIPFPYDRQTADDFIAKVESEIAAGRAVVFAVEDRLDRQLLGCVGSSIDEERAEIGYWFGHGAWGRGYATEALSRFLRLLFDHFDIDVAWASVLPENKASRRVLDKAGFLFEERRRVDLPARGIAADLDFLCLDRASWEEARRGRTILLVVAVALIDVDGKVLLAQRPPGKSMAGQWEFPGGKVNTGETPERALIRELKEELGIDVSQSCLAPLAFASHDYDGFHLLMPLYACRQWRGMPQPREGQQLKWVAPAHLSDYPMPPADIPLVALLRDWLV
ncbi:MAG TPA: bifunctional GNAT family N-acetyltransferase/(deoxy)nucleoside triphosphate pyrophosphohydrolase [Telmatospirillum sp.]|nr:bifunctional GNAT family N-acetyltransferase/(deoxy)nucleoside triphosphate pyrophosphohydrolase [Telmatospirillum sp.]